MSRNPRRLQPRERKKKKKEPIRRIRQPYYNLDSTDFPSRITSICMSNHFSGNRSIFRSLRSKFQLCTLTNTTLCVSIKSGTYTLEGNWNRTAARATRLCARSHSDKFPNRAVRGRGVDRFAKSIRRATRCDLFSVFASPVTKPRPIAG